MVSSARTAIACTLLILSTIVFAHSQSVSDKSSTGTISGRVTLKGKGLSGVVVGLTLAEYQRHQPARHRSVTDEEGNYRITNVPPGSYEVAVSTPAYAAAGGSGMRRKSLIIGKNETVENVDFALVRGGVITGKVTDSDGRPVIEIEVSVSPIHTDHSLRGGIRTDDRGIYRIFGLSPGKYRVSAGQEDHSNFGDPWSTSDYRLTFHPAAVDPSQATIIEVTEGSETANVDIAVARSMVKYSASGRIVDGDTGQPIADVSYGVYMFVTQNHEGSRTSGALTNKEGEFKLENLPPGKYAVIVEPQPDSEWLVEPVRFEVIDHDVTGLVVKTSKGGTASGVIVLEGEDSKLVPNMAQNRIIAYVGTRSRNRGLNQEARINPDGSFRISGLPGGLLSLWLSARDHLRIVRLERDGIAYSNTLEIKELEQVTNLRVVVNYANGTIRGVVKLATGGAPPEARFSVTLKRMGSNPEVWTSNDSARVDARGQFVAERLLPGTYEVKASLFVPNDPNAKVLQTTQQVVVTSGGVSNITLTLPQD
jgi:hypothetical protein